MAGYAGLMRRRTSRARAGSPSTAANELHCLGHVLADLAQSAVTTAWAPSPIATDFASLHRRDHFNLRLGHRSSPRITLIAANLPNRGAADTLLHRMSADGEIERTGKGLYDLSTARGVRSVRKKEMMRNKLLILLLIGDLAYILLHLHCPKKPARERRTHGRAADDRPRAWGAGCVSADRLRGRDQGRNLASPPSTLFRLQGFNSSSDFAAGRQALKKPARERQISRTGQVATDRPIMRWCSADLVARQENEEPASRSLNASGLIAVQRLSAASRARQVPSPGPRGGYRQVSPEILTKAQTKKARPRKQLLGRVRLRGGKL